MKYSEEFDQGLQVKEVEMVEPVKQESDELLHIDFFSDLIPLLKNRFNQSADKLNGNKSFEDF